MVIQQLPEHLANKIAAGEVVERPASVVKELIENSIDAGSTQIKIELIEAGMAQIKVTDNGSGMGNADCKKAFLRHATSKIKYDADLFHIRSLGFRGEALASIAAVSKMTLTSSQGSEAGSKLIIEAGEIISEAKGSARQGTEIVVNELFYNTPARLKYLKSIHTELGHISDLVNRYALAHANIRFELFHNHKVIFRSAGNDNVLQVISQIYGMQIAKNMLQTSVETLDFSISAFIAKPEITRSNRNYMTTIVNGRYVKNQAINHAIIRAYDTLLPIRRFPVTVIFIELDPILIDVNVHPTKLEIRFSKEKELVHTVEQLVKERLNKQTLIPKVTHQPKTNKVAQATFDLNYKQATNYQEEVNIDQTQDDDEKKEQRALFNENRVVVDNWEIENTNQAMTDLKLEEAIVFEQQAAIAADEADTERIPNLYPIGQLQGTYILAQNELGFYMIDQHAAQERIKYEFFKEKLASPSNELQQLLIPLTFEFTYDETVFIEKYFDELQAVGIFLEAFGHQTFAVRSHPNWFPKDLVEEIIRDIIAQVIREGTIKIGVIREELAILMACKRSIKANHYLTQKEMEHLLEDLRKTKDPFTCPHGRPVIIEFTYYEIEKMFKRIM